MTTGNKEVVRSRPGDISNYESVIQSSFHFQSKDKHLSHINSVHSGFFSLTHALYHRKRIESCDGSLTLQDEHHCAHSFRLLFLPYNYCCFSVVKFMGKQIRNSNSGKQNDICGEKSSEKYSEF